MSGNRKPCMAYGCACFMRSCVSLGVAWSVTRVSYIIVQVVVRGQCRLDGGQVVQFKAKIRVYMYAHTHLFWLR